MTTAILLVQQLAETEALGLALGPWLFPGAVIALDGQLGAGKTHFVRAVAAGLQVRNPAVVNSPTFVLIQEYPARLPIYHFDAYRLRDASEFQELGSDEYLRGDGVCLIEWAEKVRTALPAEYLQIELTIENSVSRRIHAHAYGEIYQELLKNWLHSPEVALSFSVTSG